MDQVVEVLVRVEVTVVVVAVVEGIGWYRRVV